MNGNGPADRLFPKSPDRIIRPHPAPAPKTDQDPPWGEMVQLWRCGACCLSWFQPLISEPGQLTKNPSEASQCMLDIRFLPSHTGSCSSSGCGSPSGTQNCDSWNRMSVGRSRQCPHTKRRIQNRILCRTGPRNCCAGQEWNKNLVILKPKHNRQNWQNWCRGHTLEKTILTAAKPERSYTENSSYISFIDMLNRVDDIPPLSVNCHAQTNDAIGPGQFCRSVIR